MGWEIPVQFAGQVIRQKKNEEGLIVFYTDFATKDGPLTIEGSTVKAVTDRISELLLIEGLVPEKKIPEKK